ncbi:hypothetical protein [Deinococcus sp. 23YEL01]|uniref:hypothetical protein n=1 Tax=Deinococcus sp. 23YEL01 TaxID=2745871 RepID=UPI001E3D01A2|nr:hypothetical protein [Deinococcus sp. 23YEL01]MCD0168033.1 hypothetical protein [Deinococcus sp. 23YEL01]
MRKIFSNPRKIFYFYTRVYRFGPRKIFVSCTEFKVFGFRKIFVSCTRFKVFAYPRLAKAGFTRGPLLCHAGLRQRCPPLTGELVLRQVQMDQVTALRSHARVNGDAALGQQLAKDQFKVFGRLT